MLSSGVIVYKKELKELLRPITGKMTHFWILGFSLSE